MKKPSSNKLLVIIFFLIILICIFILYIKFNHKNTTLNSEFYPYIFLQKTDENAFKEYFQNRYVNVDFSDNTVIIGRTKKEIENGYFDIKINTNKDYLEIYINKLTKEEKVTEYIVDEYLDELYKYIKLLLNIEDNEQVIKKCIFEEFSNLRNNLEIIEENKKLKIINVENYNIEFSIEKNILKLKINTRGDV